MSTIPYFNVIMEATILLVMVSVALVVPILMFSIAYGFVQDLRGKD